MQDAKDHLIVGLDVPTVDRAEAIVETLGDSIGFYKIGYSWCLPAVSNSPATSSPTASGCFST